MPSTKWYFVAECHRSLLNGVMNQKLLKGGRGNGYDIVCNELF